jgi:hypothetical protein
MVASVVVTYFWAVPYVAGESLAVVALAGLDGGSCAGRRDGRLGALGRLPVLSAAGVGSRSIWTPAGAEGTVGVWIGGGLLARCSSAGPPVCTMWRGC